MDVTRAVAQRILEAYETGQAIAPVRGEIAGVAAAYRVQSETARIWRERGRRICGRKIGLTAKAVQAQLGVDEPDFGTLYADMVLRDGASVPPGAVMQPRIEGEIAFVLKTNLGGDRITPEAVIDATDYVCPAIEICGSRIAGWDIRIEDTIADNASSGLIVLGDKRAKPSLPALASVALSVEHNGAVAAEGRGEACLGNPAIAVAWLAEALSRFGDGLRAGDVVMSGALAKMLAAAPGDQFTANFGAMGTVSVSFAAKA
jgi:2-keto-4-pentenoate hydratase